MLSLHNAQILVVTREDVVIVNVCELSLYHDLKKSIRYSANAKLHITIPCFFVTIVPKTSTFKYLDVIKMLL